MALREQESKEEASAAACSVAREAESSSLDVLFDASLEESGRRPQG